jgi:hypothetical protein
MIPIVQLKQNPDFMAKYIYVPDSPAAEPDSSLEGGLMPIMGTFLAVVALGLIGVSVYDRINTGSWWFRRLASENQLRESEGEPKKSVLSQLGSLFSSESNDGW